MPGYGGLEINPCIPKAWPGFSVRRRFRGAEYAIEVKNPDGISKGVRQLIVDGVPHKGHVVPAFDDGKLHTVEVIMGLPAAESAAS